MIFNKKDNDIIQLKIIKIIKLTLNKIDGNKKNNKHNK